MISMNLHQLQWHDVLGLSVLAAVVTTLGSLAATILKEFFFARSVERWKSQQQLREVYLKLRDPLLLATIDMVHRFIEIAFETQVDFLESSLLKSNPNKMSINSAHDPYYQRYKLISTLYRLCAWFGWVELYRQQVAFLDSGQQKTNSDFERHIQVLRSSFADGNLNQANDWQDWNDYLIFREEQRAIGEILLEHDRPSVIGYGDFNDRLLSPTPDQENRWITIALHFLMDFRSVPEEGNRDFRKARCLLIIKHGVSLIECLNRKRITQYLKQARTRAEHELLAFKINSDALIRR
jgi:hypothetical protein